MRCAVFDCQNCNDKKRGNQIRFYCMPKNVELQKKWLHFCRRKDEINVNTARICSHHFTPDDIVRNLQKKMGKNKVIYKPIS